VTERSFPLFRETGSVMIVHTPGVQTQRMTEARSGEYLRAGPLSGSNAYQLFGRLPWFAPFLRRSLRLRPRLLMVTPYVL
jgi:hypothetical protein